MRQAQAQRQTVNVRIVQEKKKKRRSTRKRAPVRRPQISFPPAVIQVVQERYFPGVPPNPPPQAPFQPPVTPKAQTATAFGTQTVESTVFDELTREEMRTIQRALYDVPQTQPMSTQTVEPAFFVPFQNTRERGTQSARPTLSDFNALAVNIDPVQSNDFGIQSVASTFTSSTQTMDDSIAPMVDATPSFTEVAAPRRTQLLAQVAALGIKGVQNLTIAKLQSILDSDNPITQANRFKKGKAIAAPLSEVASPFVGGKRQKRRYEPYK